MKDFNEEAIISKVFLEGRGRKGKSIPTFLYKRKE